ncbi:cysteine hydrolase [soil metagenome]
MLTGKTALIVNEMQLGVVDPAHSNFRDLANQVQDRGIIPKMAKLADAFRKAGLPVVHTPVIHRPDLRDLKANSLINALSIKKKSMTEGSVEAAYVDELQPVDGDFVIVRTSGLIAMCATQLDAMLRRMDVQTIVLTGVSTNVAMAGNSIVASELGYHVVIPEDCIAGSDPETHQTIVNNQLRMVARIVTFDDVMAAVARQTEAV